MIRVFHLRRFHDQKKNLWSSDQTKRVGQILHDKMDLGSFFGEDPCPRECGILTADRPAFPGMMQ